MINKKISAAPEATLTTNPITAISIPNFGASVNDILSRLRGVRRSGGGWLALCPAHNDKRASLSVKQTHDQKILLYCHASCRTEDICAAIGLTMKDLFAEQKRQSSSEILATYDYKDESGKLVFQVVRMSGKQFRQRRPDGAGGWIWNLNGVQRVLYRLPELTQAVKAGETIYVCEGEKDVLNLAKLGLAATTNAGGAGKWLDYHSDYLKNANVTILPDNDEPGKKHAEQVAQSLASKAKLIKILELPGLPQKGDVSNWLQAGGTKEKLLQLVAECPDWKPTSSGQEPTEARPVQNLTDMGNARRFVRQAAGNLRFLVEQQKWIHWTGKRWEIDKSGESLRVARRAVKGIYAEAAAIQDVDLRKAVAQHAARSENESKLIAMVSLARSEPEVPISLTELDRDPWLLNCENGTFNLKTFELQPHRATDFITKLCPVAYEPDAQSSLWDGFVERILPDPESRRYVQKAAGYSLTGDTSMEKLFFAYGPPATGKTTFLSAIAAVLGDYAATADFESFLQRDHANGSPRNDIARLTGKRFVQSVEVAEGQRFAEALINQLTGRDTISARFLYQEAFEFQPAFKIWLAANNRPRISGPEGAIWRRLVQIPFLIEIPENERDPELKARLCGTERSAVLTWLTKGCQLWQTEGLREPAAVKNLTREYREESNELRDFIDDKCILSPTAQIRGAELWAAYLDWCKAVGERHPLGRKRFSQVLFARGLDQHKASDRIWIGISLA